jgi:hypothetical protein
MFRFNITYKGILLCKGGGFLYKYSNEELLEPTTKHHLTT